MRFKYCRGLQRSVNVASSARYDLNIPSRTPRRNQGTGKNNHAPHRTDFHLTKNYDITDALKIACLRSALCSPGSSC
eukprot:scaffold173285_cov38-Prasinocladus_malaysianus.AAC.3